MKRKIVIFGSYNKQSVGDKAILISLIDLLFKNAGTRITIQVVCFDAQAVKAELNGFEWSSSVDVVPIYTNSPSSVQPAGAERSGGFKNKIRKFIPSGAIHLLNSIKFFLTFTPKFDTKADLLIIGGGNLLMDMFPSWMIMPFTVSRKFNGPYTIAGVGAFPIKTLLGKFLIKRLLAKSKLNYVRDEKSHDFIKNVYRLPCKLHPDFAFSFPHQPHQGDPHRRDIVAVNIAPVFGEQWPYKDPEKYRFFISSITDSIYHQVLMVDPNRKILFFDSNFPTDRIGAIDVIEQLIARGISRDRLLYKDQLMTTKEIIESIQGVRYCIVTRLHAGILSLDAGLPVLGIAYQPKVKDVFDSVALGGNVISIDEMHKFAPLLAEFEKNEARFVMKDDLRQEQQWKNDQVIQEILDVM